MDSYPLMNPYWNSTDIDRDLDVDAFDVVTLAVTYGSENPAHLEYQKRSREKGRMSGQVRIRVRFEKTVTKWFDWLMVSREEMKELVKGAGWKVKRYLDSEKPRYIAIIEKKA